MISVVIRLLIEIQRNRIKFQRIIRKQKNNKIITNIYNIDIYIYNIYILYTYIYIYIYIYILRKEITYSIPNQPFKFKARKWIGINDYVRGTYNTNSKYKFETIIFKARLCDYSDAYIFFKGTIEVLQDQQWLMKQLNDKMKHIKE